MAKEIYILSDIHLGVGLDTDWYKRDEHESQLIGLLEDLQNIAQQTENEVEIVLAGDIFDTWLCNMSVTPPTINEILEFNSDVIDEIGKCLEHCKVFYLNGNHDMNVTADDLKSIHAPDSKRNKLICINAYRTGMMKIEHGHRYAMFNAKDKLHDPKHGLPLGYFITRILAEDKTYSKPGAIASYIDDMLEAAFTTKTISSSVIEAIMEHTGKELDDTFDMPFERRKVTIREVMEKYKKLFELWADKFGYLYTINSARAEMGNLNWFADRISSRSDYKVVVMGHTHDCLVDKDSLFQARDSIYANSGFWATDQPSYIKVLKEEGKYEVSLIQKTKKTKKSRAKFVVKEKKKV